MFHDCSGLTSVTIPDNVTSIDSTAFAGCSGLTSIIIPNSVTSIGREAFSRCSSLTSVTIPNNVTSIYWGTFYKCSSLTSIMIPNCVTNIGDYAFYNCSSLTSISIPKSVSVIGNYAFANCSNLSSVLSENEIPYEISTSAFLWNYFDAELMIPAGTKSAYLSTAGWNNFKNIVEVEVEKSVVSALNYSREYGEDNPTFEYIVEGFDLKGSPSINCEAQKTSPVGIYAIKISKGSITNSNVTYVDGTLTITKAPLTVTAKDCSREQGQANPTFELTYSGFKNNETESVLIQKPTTSTVATTSSTPGQYDITVSGGEAQNYSFRYNKGVLTVTEKDEVLFTIDGITYHGSKSEKAVKVNYVEKNTVSLEIPASVSDNGTVYQLTGIDNDAFKGCNMAALVWNVENALPNNAFSNASIGSNFLLYVKSAAYAPSSVKNVVVNGAASSIQLSDNGGQFYCPQAFTAKSISYTHNYMMETGGGKGWESLALPFDVQRIVHSTRGEIVPFALYSSSSSQKPFWLARFSGSEFKRASAIEANEPYIIAMPNNSKYKNEYNLAGDVTFSAENAAVPKTPSFNGKFQPAFAPVAKSNAVMALNNSRYSGGYDAGSRFISGLRDVRPFEAYMTGSSSTRGIIEINFDDGTTDIDDILLTTNEEQEITIHSLSGQHVTNTTQCDFNAVWQKLPKGVYIVNGKKMIK